MADAALITAITGIVVSGVVGPAVTGWVTRANERRRLDREQAAKRRDDLRELVDEAAGLLAAGATNLRLMWEAQAAGSTPLPDVVDWPSKVYVLEQRLRLRLAADHEVVQRYEAVRGQLVAAAEARDDEESHEAALSEFERLRGAFLDAGRAELERPVKTPGDRGRLGRGRT
jgi:hypothetical protein